MTDQAAQKIGEQLIEVLGLSTHNGRVNTSWGTKTPVGLANTVERIISEWKVQVFKIEKGESK